MAKMLTHVCVCLTLLALATLASAECRWVLTAATSVIPPAGRSTEALPVQSAKRTYKTRAECEAKADEYLKGKFAPGLMPFAYCLGQPLGCDPEVLDTVDPSAPKGTK